MGRREARRAVAGRMQRGIDEGRDRALSVRAGHMDAS